MAELVSTREKRLHAKSVAWFKRHFPDLAQYATVDTPHSAPSVMDHDGNIIPIMEEY